MKWLLTLLLWTLAVVVALGMLWRLWRGKPMVLRGRWKPAFVRMVAVVLVFLGIGTGKTAPAPVTPTDPKKGKVDVQLPPHITADVVNKWLNKQHRASDWMRFKQMFTAVNLTGRKPTEAEVNFLTLHAARESLALRTLLLADIKALQTGQPAQPATIRDLTNALDEAERAGYVDPWLGAYIWRKASLVAGQPERKQLIDLLAKLHRHGKLSNALTAAGARVRPLMMKPQAWGTKGGGPRPPLGGGFPGGGFGGGPPVDLLPTVKTLYPTADAGTWDTQALTIFAVGQGSAPATVIRAGQVGVPQTSGMVRFGRLDLLETTPGDKPVILVHRVFGTLELPAGKLISVWDLPQFLSAKGKEQLKKTVADALDGKEVAARLLEQHLPLASPFVREGLKATPTSKGGAQLRLIMTQFDDLPPAPPVPSLIGDDVFPGGGGFGGGGIGGGGGGNRGGR